MTKVFLSDCTQHFDLSDKNGLFVVQVTTDHLALRNAPQTALIQGVEGDPERGLFYFEMTETVTAADLESDASLDAFLFEHSDSGYSETVTEITPDIVELINGDRPWWDGVDADEIAAVYL